MSRPVLHLKQFSRFPNFGDLIGTYLLEHVWGGSFQVVGPEVVGKSNALLVGSILHWADPWSTVCGAGALSPRMVPLAFRKATLVRGPLTQAALRSAGFTAPDTIGDPGYLLPSFFDPPVPVANDIGVVLHYADQSADLIAEIRREGLLFIDILQPVEQVVTAIKRCSIILSSSLHGMIAADAYGIPTAWIEVGDNLHGGHYKFHDYLMSQGVEKRFLSPQQVTLPLRAMARQAFVKPERINRIAAMRSLEEGIRDAVAYLD
jgi:pyruvyltransferase